MIHSRHLDEDQLRGADADQLEVPTAWTSFPMREGTALGVAPDLGGPAMARIARDYGYTLLNCES
jgi:hypothetical protein